MNNSRKCNWDFAKLILMFFIVFGHICPTPEETWNFPTRLVGLFAIPLFFYISGFFQSSVNGVRELYRKYIRTFFRIVIPQLSWGLLYVVLVVYTKYPVSNLENIETVGEYLCEVLLFLKYTPFYIAGIFWFLTALLMCIVFGSLLSLIMTYRRTIAMFLIAISPFVFILMPQEYYHFSFIWFFYAMGMLCRQLETKLLFPYRSYKALLFFSLLSILVVIIANSFYPLKSFYYASNLVNESPLQFILFRWGIYTMASFTALFWIMLAYKTYETTSLIQTLSSYGKDTLFIYCSHVLLLVFLYFPIKMSFLPNERNALSVAITSFLSMIVSFLLYAFLQKLCIILKRYKWSCFLLMGINK